MGSGWKVGRVAGIDLAIHPSWLVIAFLLTFSLADALFPRLIPGWTTGQYWLVGVGTAFLFFASVLAHEFSHAIIARRLGLKVAGITLFIFGGATSIETDSRSARDEALIALAGPVASLLIGGAFLGIGALVPQPEVRAIVGWLGIINIVLGAFNLVPGYPMDGGRVLRAILWRVRGDPLTATRQAAMVGRVIGYLMVAGGIYWALRSRDIGSGLWLALVGWFLATSAEATMQQAGVERSLSGVRVRDAMDATPPAISPNESVADLVSERMLRGDDRSFLVRHPDGGLAGMVTLGDVRRLPRDSWADRRVTDIMTRYGDLATIGPDEPLADALRLIQEREVGQLPVIGDEARQPLGIVTRSGILRLIDARLKLGV
ncbi:MAG: site-2 protease family protein [Chloroflexota bacterium]|jgi:Zn-dependent protease|nr:site-2 protease family protein [Chloroflexota bacterium]